MLRKQMPLAMAVVVLLAGCGYNKLQGLDEDVKAAWSEVQNQYQRRADLVPNLVETVKGYAKHERETLQSVVEARAKATSIQVDASSLSDKAKVDAFEKAQSGLSQSLGRLLAVAENYPTLRADSGFADLRAQLEGTENRISVARRRYIASVADFNKAVRFFPTNLTAKFLLGLQPRETFTAPEEAQKNPQVKF